MGLFSSDDSSSVSNAVAVDPAWAKSPKGHFHRLISLEPDQVGLPGQGGVYVVWHKGVRPEWVYVASDDDLGQALMRALDDEEIFSYEPRGGLWCTWSFIRPEYRDGAVLYLRRLLKTVVEPRPGDEIDEEKVKPVAVLPPG
ncbi:conserved hypothetical protein [Rhodospirillaceae bacterium LM-1]|nr:conserved hypothetical protein [Rhodospirillaceae bacterium LM-1]